MLEAIRFLLLPFSWVYGLAVLLRNFLYDRHVLKNHKFNLPVIVVGNLEVGGSGKTPVIEYLIRLLKDEFRIAVLSRGYGRKTTGFIRAGAEAGQGSEPGAEIVTEQEISALTIGDEPFQYFSAFGDITVAVGEDRVAAIRHLEDDHDLVLLDDAFQHRRLDPGMSILVLDYNTLFKPRFLLPAGNYREAFSGRSRADVLLISKAPPDLDENERERIIKRVAPASGQLVCCSSLEYQPLQTLQGTAAPTEPGPHTYVLLLTGIARPAPLLAHIKGITPHVIHLKYPDHHSYSVKNIAKIAEIFDSIASRDKMILTTEKDAARLRGAETREMLRQLPVFYRPVRVSIHEPEREMFREKVLKYVRRIQLLLIMLMPLAAMAQLPGVTDSADNADSTGTPGRRESTTPGNDTLRIYSPLTVTLINELSMNSDSLVTHPIDTSINKFQNYSEFYRNNDYYVNLGNLGLAARNLLADFDKGIGFRTGQRALDIYQYDKTQIDYYRTRSPFTELYYVSGGRPEQIFRFIHTQNIKPRLNAGVEYRKIGSEGYYPNQKTNHLNLAAFAWYQSENLRYNLIGNIVYTDLRAPENGGLINDSIFDIPSNQDQILQENVFLEEAQTRWRGTSVYLKQYYNIGRVNTIDTGKSYAEKVYPQQRVSHSIYLENRNYTYQDMSGNPSYYYFIYNSEPNPLDSIHYSNLENEFTLSVFGRTGRRQRTFSKAAILQAGIKHRLISYAQDAIDTNFHVLSLKGQAGYQFSDRLGILFNGERVFLGPYDGDLSLSADARLFINENIGEIRMRALYQRKRPEFMFDNYYSSYHRWRNDFERENLSQLSFSYYHDKLKLGLSAEYSLISNYAFFRGVDSYIVPHQFTGEMDVLKVTLEKDVNFLRNFVFSGHAVYQHTNFHNILLTPKFYGYGSLYYKNKLFKVLDFQLGFDVRYFSETPAYSYAPELGRFYVDDNPKTIGDYPMVDLFLTADLRRTRFLVKFDHANQGFPARGYYTVKRYPMPSRTLKFGVSWRFYD